MTLPPVNRREFLGTTTTTALGLAAGSAGVALAASPTAIASSPRWFHEAYRRAVIDMHIPDWDDKFLSQFDPDEYVQMLVRSRAQSIVCYAHSHVGLFNYPTKIGHQHRAFHERNVLQEVIDRCHENKIAVVLYTSLIFDRDAADHHPEWRMRTWDGKVQGEGGRHGVLCINSPYREYVRSLAEELATTFQFEGIRFDMTFWPWLCYCEHCQQRFEAEVGGELPKTVDWLDENWVAFQRCRERWLVEFASIATAAVRKHQPQASVEHQSSTYPLNWMFGVTADLARQNDFLQGDFYGDALQGSFVRKLLEDLTPNRPFGYETSFSLALKDHTAMKSAALLEAKAAAAIADSAAFIFIDAIDPIGTVNHRAHDRMGQIFDRLMPYYEHLGGERVADVAVFYSLESKFNMTANGRHVSSPDTSDAHTESTMNAARWLIGGHRPFRVMTKQNLDQLGEIKVLVLSNVNMMDEEECDVIREWVKAGGRLYASGGTSLVNKQGQKQPDFLLADVLGVSVRNADWQHRNHYIAPTPEGQELFAEFDARYPAFCSGYGLEVEARPEAVVLATTTLPWPAPNPTQFSSIHSDPPWVPTDRPEIVQHRYGQGQAIYCSSLIENLEVLGPTFLKLLDRLNPEYRYEIHAPSAVEVTLFRQPDRQRLVLTLANFQKEMPNIPVQGIEVRLRLDARIQEIRRLPDNHRIPMRQENGQTVFNCPPLETLQMFAVQIG